MMGLPGYSGGDEDGTPRSGKSAEQRRKDKNKRKAQKKMQRKTKKRK